MAFLDLCRFLPSAGGTTDWTYASTVGGCQSPAQAGAVNGLPYKVYAVSNDLTQWEVSQGIYNSSTGTFPRTTVLYNSSGNTSKINFAAVPNVAVVGLAEDLLAFDAANSFTDTQKAQALANLGVPFNCGRMSYVSATALAFKPYNGDCIKINGGVYRIPPAGIAGLATTAVFVNGVGGSNLAANTLYYVYVFNNAGTLTADFRTTNHTQSITPGNVGVEINNVAGGDAYTLIGMAYTNASAQFSASLVASWFNRITRQLSSPVLSPGSPGAYFIEVGGGSSLALPGLRVYFLVWSDENAIEAKYFADVTVTTNSNVGLQIAINGTQVGAYSYPLFNNSNNNFLSTCANPSGLAEGLNYAVPFGGSNAGSVAYNNSQMMVTVRG